MQGFFHSVRLNADRCKGCVNCIKHCPTEAIRIRNGKAEITEERCIDCGECIRQCANHAKTAVTDKMADLERFRYNIALPAPSLYAQFPASVAEKDVVAALISIGFDDVFEVAWAAELVSAAITEFLNSPIRQAHKKPLLSSACPAVVRLVQVRFPELLDYIVPIPPPVEVAAIRARQAAVMQTGFGPEEIGVWFITPCPAKATTVRHPLGLKESALNGAISMARVYGEIRRAMRHLQPRSPSTGLGRAGIGWAAAGGETEAAHIQRSIVVHGIHEIAALLEQVAMNKLFDLDYIECLACSGGCLGGPLAVENRFVAEKNLKNRMQRLPETTLQSDVKLADLAPSVQQIEPRSMLAMDVDIAAAMRKIEAMELVLARLPGLDCGSCGSPNCKALAEDIIQGLANETDCVFRLRDRVKNLAEEMVDLAQRLPPSLTRMADNSLEDDDETE